MGAQPRGWPLVPPWPLMAIAGLKAWYEAHPWLHWSHLVQWLLTALVGVATFAIILTAKPHCKWFDPSDPEIRQPYVATQTFANWTIPIIGWLIPFVMGAIVILIKRSRITKEKTRLFCGIPATTRPGAPTGCTIDLSPKRCVASAPDCSRQPEEITSPGSQTTPQAVWEQDRDANSRDSDDAAHEQVHYIMSHTSCLWHDLHTLGLCMWQAAMMAILLTTALKYYAGRHRPDFVNRLILFADFDPHAWNMSDPASVDAMLEEVCAARNIKEVVDGMMSFPSGHSSFAFAGWTVVCLVIAAATNVRSRFGFGYALLAMLPCFPPAIIAVSRTRDNRHHWADVLSGSLIGMVFGAVAFSVHYSLKSSDPYNSRTEESLERRVEMRRRRKLRREVGELVMSDISVTVSQAGGSVFPRSPQDQDQRHLLVFTPEFVDNTSMSSTGGLANILQSAPTALKARQSGTVSPMVPVSPRVAAATAAPEEVAVVSVDGHSTPMSHDTQPATTNPLPPRGAQLSPDTSTPATTATAKSRKTGTAPTTPTAYTLKVPAQPLK